MASFSEVNTPSSNNRREAWQKHHVVPTQQFRLVGLTDLFDEIQDPSLPNGVRYQHNLFDFNGLLLPTGLLESSAFGFAVHNGSHSAISGFVARILGRIQGDLIAGTLTAEQAARSVRGFQAYLIDKLTVDRHTNPLTGEYFAHAEFFLNTNDPWLAVFGGGDAAAEVYDGITLGSIRGGLDETDTTLPFWRGYNSDDDASLFAGFDYLNRFGSIYDPYFQYENGVYASSVERFIARERGVGLAEVTDFVDLKLGEFLVNEGDGYRPEALIWNDVAFYQENADYSKTINVLTSRIDAALGFTPSALANTLMVTGAIGTFEADYAFAPDGTGLIISTPTEATVTDFLNVTDEILDSLPDIPFKEEARDVLDKAQELAGGVVTRLIGEELAGLKLPHLTIAKDGVSGLGHDGIDLMLGLGSAELAGQGGDDWLIHLGDGDVSGGIGDDVVLSIGNGEGAITVGGEGSDLIYNSSYKGQLWGDGQDGRGVSYTGDNNDDTFWWSSGSFIMDAGKNDRLQLFGLPLVGGTNNGLYGIALEKNTARDFFIPWVTYGLTETNQLLVAANPFLDGLDPDMSEDEILEIAQVVENWESGDLGIEFTIFGGENAREISLFRALFSYIGDFASAAGRFAKNLTWRPADDPLVLDLNGDGLVSKGIGAVYWDNDGDLFGEESGWLSGEDGFLVHDADGSGTISAEELFGGPGLSGYTELTDWDSNGDGIVDASDVAFGDLQIWRDANENGITDAGELHELGAFGITAFSVNSQPVDITTANGTIIRAESFYAREDGSQGALGELIFETDRGATQYLGDDRVAAFAPKGVSGEALDAFGYGITTDLAVAASNDNTAMSRMGVV